MYFAGPNYLDFRDLYVTCLQLATTVGVAISVVISVDRLVHVLKYFQIKISSRIRGSSPAEKFRFKSLPEPVNFSHMYPRVAVQLPMFNERYVCQDIINAACSLSWPRNRLMVQVLDDSTDKETRQLVDEKVMEWRDRGVNCVCIRRTNRQGYKAGALREGFELLISYEYIAIFDADFKPKSDFLHRTIPYLQCNDELGYVQTRWEFENPDESYLTKAQEMSLNFHMKCEQFVHSTYGSFFNFNGTAGVWRRSCIESAGGWNGRTTVEDMDLSLRAYLGGWRALFLDDTTCMNQLPSSFSAYRKQQHRWTCGPIQLWSRASAAIWASKISLLSKMELNIMYFFMRKSVMHFASFGFFCFLVPLSVFTPEVSIPMWALVQLPVTVTLTTALFTPNGWAYAIPYVLFENAMGIVRVTAAVTGIFDLGRAHEWIVTQKAGRKEHCRPCARTWIRLYVAETLMSIFMLACASHAAFAIHRWMFSVFIFLQGITFLAFGVNAVDCGGLLGRRVYSVERALRGIENVIATPRALRQSKAPDTHEQWTPLISKRCNSLSTTCKRIPCITISA
eukprot:evm.model.scf_730EXC.1 EVM.evm.TU.scf_730EXC.1   scf_730EXC:15780-23573(+)